MTAPATPQDALMELVANMTPIRDAVAGYREALIRDNGFGPDAAEAMAVDFHRYLVAAMIGALT